MAKFASQHRAFNLFKFIFTAVLPLVLWMLMIFLLSSRQKVAFTDNYPVSFAIFKSLHLVEYAILFFLWARTLVLLKINNPFYLALFFTFAYGLSDELHQSFINGREGKLLDAFVDGLGGILAWIAIKKFRFINKLLRL